MNTPSAHSRRSILKLLGATAVGTPFLSSHAFAAASDKPLRHASFGTSGMAWEDLTHIAACEHVEIVALCDVDTSRTAEARKMFPAARVYQDWRVLLEKEADKLDSVNVSTPDHMHAPIALASMKLGKHVYGQKPLAHDLYEVRRMTEMAKEKKVVTQMGIQIHSSSYYQTAVKAIRAGAIGKIKEVHSWSNKSWGDSSPQTDKTDPVPEGFDWDLWLGVCAERPFIGGGYYHPGTWRKRLDFGTGTLGDMGCHILDPVFGGIGLGAPIAVRSEGPPPNQWNWALNGKVIYTFGETPMTAEKTMQLTWYDGEAKVSAEAIALIEGARLPAQGSLFIGTEGAMLLPHVGIPKFFSSVKFKDYKAPPSPDINHWQQFVEACRGNGKTGADFAYAGPLTEAILLGGIASRFQNRKLEWNSKDLSFDFAEANQYVRRKYRKGWESV